MGVYMLLESPGTTWKTTVVRKKKEKDSGGKVLDVKLLPCTTQEVLHP